MINNEFPDIRKLDSLLHWSNNSFIKKNWPFILNSQFGQEQANVGLICISSYITMIILVTGRNNTINFWGIVRSALNSLWIINISRWFHFRCQWKIASNLPGTGRKRKKNQNGCCKTNDWWCELFHDVLLLKMIKMYFKI